MERPQPANARTNDVETRKVQRRLVWPGISRSCAEEGLAVAAIEQEDEPLQVLAQLVDVAGGTIATAGNDHRLCGRLRCRP